MPFRVLIAEHVAQEGIDLLATETSVDQRAGLSADELLRIIGDYDALVVRSATQVTHDVIDAGRRLRVIARAGVGVDNIDVAAATDRGIVVVNAPTGNTAAAAELAVALMLALARHIPSADATLRAGEWNRRDYVGVELRGKTVGIVGLGQVGSAVARRLRAMEMTVLAHDPFVPDDRARVIGAELIGLEELLRRSDFVSLHTTLTPGAAPLIGAVQLALMKPSARLVNTARGSLVDEPALLAALDAGNLAGAALDVYTEEPASDNPLCRHPRVVCTPHLGASTQEAQEQVAVDVGREILNVLAGRPASAAVNAPLVDPESLEVVGPYLAVARMTGTLAVQLAEGQWESLRIEYQGVIATHDVTPLKAAGVAGMLSTISEEQVNLVSVNNIIAHRGWQVREEKHDDAGAYSNLIVVHLFTSAGEVCVSGTLVHGLPHIVEINGFRVSVSAGDQPAGTANILVLHNEDRPGRVGAVGMALGAMEANISHMDVGRRDATGKAVMVVTIARALTPDEVHRLDAIDGIDHVVQAQI